MINRERGIIMSTATGFDAKTHGWSKAVVQKMGGVEIADAFLRGEYVLTKVVHGVKSFGQRFVDCDNLFLTQSLRENVLQFSKEDETSDVVFCDYIDLFGSMNDSEIINSHLGGMENVKNNPSTMGQVRALVDVQWNGEEGQLLTNGYVNVFYCFGKGGELFAVHVAYFNGRWLMFDWGLNKNNTIQRVFFNKK